MASLLKLEGGFFYARKGAGGKVKGGNQDNIKSTENSESVVFHMSANNDTSSPNYI